MRVAASTKTTRMDLNLPNELADDIRRVKEAEAARGVKTTDVKVAMQLMRWGLVTARELGRLPNPVAYE